MEIGPLEYVVLGFEDNQFRSEVLPKLNTIPGMGDSRLGQGGKGMREGANCQEHERTERTVSGVTFF